MHLSLHYLSKLNNAYNNLRTANADTGQCLWCERDAHLGIYVSMYAGHSTQPDPEKKKVLLSFSQESQHNNSAMPWPSEPCNKTQPLECFVPSPGYSLTSTLPCTNRTNLVPRCFVVVSCLLAVSDNGARKTFCFVAFVLLLLWLIGSHGFS